MGIFRGGFIFILCILLFISLLAAGSFLTLSASLKYDNVQKKITPLVYEMTSKNGLENFGFTGADLNQATDEAKKVMQDYCENENVTDYVFSFQGSTISIPCSSLTKGTNTLVNDTINSFIENSYYKDYDCGFLECFTKEEIPFFLVSQHAKDYWKEKFYFTLLASLVILVLIFFLLENKLNISILAGIVLILAALPLLKIKSLIGIFVPESFGILTTFLDIFFGKAQMVFWIFFILGLALLGLGFGLKFSNTEWVKRITEKAEKKEVKMKKK